MKNRIIFTETTSNWPNKFSANNTKIGLMAKGLIQIYQNENDNEVIIINSLFGSNNCSSLTKKIYENIVVYDFPIHRFKIISLFKNLLKHFFLLKSLLSSEKKNSVLIGGPNFLVYCLIVLYSKILGYRVIVNITEWSKNIAVKSFIKRIDNFLYCTFFGYFIDGIFPISTYLLNKVMRFNKKKLIVPILADFKSFSDIKIDNPKDYFLYCATLEYKNSLSIIIKSFELFQLKYNETKLILIVSGRDYDIDNLYFQVNKLDCKDSILIKRQIPYAELIEYYRNALALLIPLNNTIQDKARFSQKIAEYISTGRPIITNSVGDISLYFKNHESAYFATSFTIEGILDQMILVKSNIELSNKIGNNGLNIGKKNFDYLVNSYKIDDFITNL